MGEKAMVKGISLFVGRRHAGMDLFNVKLALEVKRYFEEVEFFDNYYRRGQHHAVRGWLERCLAAFYPAGFNCRGRLLMALGEVKGKRVLELGCGVGELAVALASRGAYVSAVDISLEAAKMTQEKCREYIGQVDTRRMDANELDYEDGSFDIVTGELILHHLDLAKVSGEISRVLKPYGRAVFVEPLACNLLSNMWRRLTPSIRTSGEWPLSYSDITKIGSRFNSVSCQEFGLLPLFGSPIFWSHKAKVRFGEFLARLDAPLLGVCKFLRRYSAFVLVEFRN